MSELLRKLGALLDDKTSSLQDKHVRWTLGAVYDFMRETESFDVDFDDDEEFDDDDEEFDDDEEELDESPRDKDSWNKEWNPDAGMPEWEKIRHQDMRKDNPNLELQRGAVPCPDCEGSGETDYGHGPKQCEQCGGAGEIFEAEQVDEELVDEEQMDEIAQLKSDIKRFGNG